MSRPFLERMTVVRSDDNATLEALFHPPLPDDTRACLLVPGVPGLGGGIDHAVLAELSFAFSQQGMAVLRFNLRGVGVSTKVDGAYTLWDDTLDDDEQLALRTRSAVDVVAALQHLRDSTHADELFVVGHGYGACAVHAALQRRGNDDDVAQAFADVAAVGFVSAPFATPGAFARGVFGDDVVDIPLQVLAADDDVQLTDDVVAEANAAGVFPQRVPDADVGFTRGLTSLGKTLVARMVHD